MAKRKGRGLLVFLVIILIIAAAVIIGMQLVNKKASELLSEQVDIMLEENGLAEDMTYDEIVVEAGKGKITLKGAAVRNPETGVDITAEEFYIIVPPSEAVDFLRNMNNPSLNSIKFGGFRLDAASSDGSAGAEISDFDISFDGELGALMKTLQDISSPEALSGIDLSKVDVSAEVNDVVLNDEYRSMFMPFIEETGQTLPEDGPFSATFTQIKGSEPELLIK